MRVKKKITIRELLVDPIPNSPTKHYSNHRLGSKKNYNQYLGSERVKRSGYFASLHPRPSCSKVNNR